MGGYEADWQTEQTKSVPPGMTCWWVLIRRLRCGRRKRWKLRQVGEDTMWPVCTVPWQLWPWHDPTNTQGPNSKVGH